jgi:O-antigen ligase
LNHVNTDHYTQGVHDVWRSINNTTTKEWVTHSALAFIFGNGYGSIWQWYAYQQGVLPKFEILYQGVPMLDTQYGFILYHAHSVFNQLFGELGLVGIMPFLGVIFIMIREFFKSSKAKNELRANILGALICTIPIMHTDLFFFRNWEISIVWLFYLFTALAYPISNDVAKEQVVETVKRKAS